MSTELGAVGGDGHESRLHPKRDSVTSALASAACLVVTALITYRFISPPVYERAPPC